MQIFWINIIMDGPLAQSLGVEQVDAAVMQRPPRNVKEDIITKPLLLRVLTSGFLILIGTMYVFIHEMEDGEITQRALTMTFTTFIMFDMFNALSCRHNIKSVFEISMISNTSFLFALVFSIGGQMLVIYFPLLQKIFKTTALSFFDFVFIIILSSSMVALDTCRKHYFPFTFTEVIPGDYIAKTTQKKGDTFMV
jgi:Ca2+-transporting ATPase